MLKALFLGGTPQVTGVALPVFYIPSQPFTVLLWPGVALGTLAFALFFWWVVRRRTTT